ncbi:MAG: sodium-translocating pyrophosphatase [Anaerolineae bacterium]|nr:MAG: sodium-translocating pyrophosphatase [Anaerolineae bacterium]MCL4880100.1 sodium-translocating pyrophosphatase [Anaerolineae bacterium]
MQQMDATTLEWVMVLSVMGVALLALAYAYMLARQILAYSKGSEAMQQVWQDIKDGANAYLRTQLRTIGILIFFLTVAMFLSVYVVEPTEEAKEIFEDNAKTVVAFARALAFLMGAGFSATVGFIGMNMAVEGNVRVAAASENSYDEALKVAYRSGTITGMLTDGLGLLGGTIIFIIFGKAAPDVLLGFGFGGTLLALFMRVGGGIYTKAADVGADLVGKVEAGMEEDDPRNAAVIADLVGDNVGDCAGMAADIFESYEVTIVSSLILGLTLAKLTGNLHYIILPLVVRGIGVVSTIIGTYAVSLWKGEETQGNAEAAMYKSYELSSVITIVSALILSYFYGEDLRVGVLIAVGVGLAVMFNPLTAYATSAKSKRVQHVASATRFGPALVILEGISLGYLSSIWSVILILMGLGGSILIYSTELSQNLADIMLVVGAVGAVAVFGYYYSRKQIMSGLFLAMWVVVAALFLYGMETVDISQRALQENNFNSDEATFIYTLFGVSLIGVGMLSLTGNNVSMDSFGPIADNANGIGEVAGLEGKAREIMADLDATGNTTKAITKGVAIGSAVIAALSLYGAFFTDIKRIEPDFEMIINLSDPKVFVGLLVGAMLPLLFSGLLIKAVNRSAAEIMAEVRRQLRIPEIWERKRKPDYTHAVAISTRSAQAELIPLGVVAVLSPIVVGLLLKEQALGGFLAGVIASGVLQAVYMANAGGAWDNAKKYIEDGNFGGKRSDNHKASVVGDTVGDPFKDTAGPALNPMIKVMNLVALIMAPIVVEYTGFPPLTVIVIAVGIIVIVWAVSQSDRQVDLTAEESGTVAFQAAPGD